MAAMTNDQLRLHGSDVVATVDLEGGRLSSLVISGAEVLVDSGDRPTRWGSFPMVPWCGRLRDGTLRFDGETHLFPLTSPPHANHGLCHTARWTQTATDTISIDLPEPWPFGGSVTQRFELVGDALTVSISVAADAVSMPAMAGWHPWFVRQLERDGAPFGGAAELTVSGGRVAEHDEVGLPTGRLIDVPPGPWDRTFVELDADPVIEWPGALRLTVSSTFDTWVIFTEPEHALCVEPQSGLPDDLNRDPRIVVPGAPLEGSMMLRWQRLDGLT